MRYLIFAVFLCFFTVSEAGANTYRDVSYGRLDRNKLDIYAPEAATSLPVMVFVHGGGWHLGNKDNVGYKPEAFNEAGYVFVSVEYPLLPRYALGVQAQSVADSIGWIHKNIEKYGGDPEKITVMGHSAGAHLVALVALDGRYMEEASSCSSVIKGVVPIDTAALDVPMRMRTLDEIPRMARVYYNTFGKDVASWTDYSPLHYMSTAKDVPPFLIFTVAERKPPTDVAKAFGISLDAIGVRNKVMPISGETHLTINNEIGGEGDLVMKEILAFFY